MQGTDLRRAIESLAEAHAQLVFASQHVPPVTRIDEPDEERRLSRMILAARVVVREAERVADGLAIAAATLDEPPAEDVPF